MMTSMVYAGPSEDHPWPDLDSIHTGAFAHNHVYSGRNEASQPKTQQNHTFNNSNFRIFSIFRVTQFCFRFFGVFGCQSPLRARHIKNRSTVGFRALGLGFAVRALGC